MNDLPRRELQAVVELAVQPVRATMARKRRMREELLAHLTAIFDEEDERLGERQAALERAKQRFGDPAELTTGLQQAVPRWDRCWSILDNIGYRPSESAWRLAARHFLTMLLIFVLWPPFWILASRYFRNPEPMETQRLRALVTVGAVICVALANVIPSVILAPVLDKIGPVLASKRWGRALLAVLCGLALCSLVLPGLAGVALVFILMARQAVNAWRYRADWA